MNLIRLFKPRIPTALQIAVAELEDAQRMHLDHCSKHEYYFAMEHMLVNRIERLRREITELSKSE